MLELACFHPQAVALAEQWGVPRVEFCAEALAGGTTPTLQHIRESRLAYSGILGAMARPVGGSFLYRDSDWLQMHRDAVQLAEQGVDFVVFGALDASGRWDAARTRSVVREASVPCVLHRVFDEDPNPLDALERAIDAGFFRILTGWGARNWEVLLQLKEAAEGRIELLPGGGIRTHNAARYREAGFSWLHTAALTPEAYAAEIPLPEQQEVLKLLQS